MSQINQIKSNDVGKNTISLEEKTVQEWLNEDEDDNIAVLYLNQIYLLNLKQINRILVIGMKEYKECGNNDNETYYDLKDIGLPGVACKTSQLDRLMFNSNMMERVNSCFVITANSTDTRIKLFENNVSECENAYPIVRGDLKALPLIRGGNIIKKRKSTKNTRRKKMIKSRKTMKTRKMRTMKKTKRSKK